jgi:UDP-N-acetylmuramate dehydrogenase
LDSVREFAAFAEKNTIRYSLDAPMADYTSFRIGGPADILLEPANREQLAEILTYCGEHSVPREVIGKGSDLLVSDEGIRGAVIHMGNLFAGLRMADESVIYADAGVSLASLCNFAKEHSFTGLEFAYGIPGSVGGGVYMNAGAYGGEMKDVLIAAEHLNADGSAGSFESQELMMSYRRSAYTDSGRIITGAYFRLQKGDPAEIGARMEELIRRRFDRQPMDLPSAGSTFKRPEGAFAAELIDRCGLKGFRIGGAEVSEKHAGFVVNRGGATCREVLELIDYVKKTVREQTGFLLEPEVKFLGF